VAGAAALLWWLSTQGVSPEQRVADAEAPPPPVVEVVVEERLLEDRVVFRGSVVAVDQVEVGPPEVPEGRLVLVDLPLAVGEAVRSGAVIAVVSDRPVIAVDMPVPFYRTLLPGVEGPDVARFQTALTDLGYPIEVNGRFGPETQTATASLYDDRGFQATTTGDDLSEALRAAELAVRAARSVVADLSSVGGTALRHAREDLQAAEDARDRAAARIGVIVPLGEVVGLPGLPGTISAVHARVGETVNGNIVSLTTSELVVRAAVDTLTGSLLRPGVLAYAGPNAEWKLEVVANTARDDQGRVIVTLVSATTIPAEMIGVDLRIEGVVAATETPVLAVPVTSIRSGPNGPFVRVVGNDGIVTNVEVVTGASIGGWVEIVDAAQPLTPGTVVRAG